MAFCAYCGKELQAAANVCPACGKAVVPTAAGTTPVSTTPVVATAGLADNVAGMLAYITIIPAIIFLVLEPYNRNRFIRFHSFQSIFFVIAWIIVWVALSFLGMLPGIHWFMIPLWPLVGLGFFILWLLLLLKAYQGLMWKLPVVGDMAERQANA